MPHRFHRQVFRDLHTLQDFCAPDVYGPSRGVQESISNSTLTQRLFVLEWREDPLSPDHVLKQRLAHNCAWSRPSTEPPLTQGARVSTLLSAKGPVPWRRVVLEALQNIGDHFLAYRAGHGVVVRPRQLQEWQQFLTRIAPLSLVVDVLRRHHSLPDLQDHAAVRAFVERNLVPLVGRSTLPTEVEPVVEAVVADGGLVESHMHLNGTTEVDITWAETVLRRRKALAELLQGSNKAEVQEQYEQIEPGLGPSRLGERIRIARRIRWWLLDRMLGRPCVPACPDTALTDDALLFVEPTGPGWYDLRRAQSDYDAARPLTQHPMQQALGYVRWRPQVWEAAWLLWMLDFLAGPRATDEHARVFLQYLLILNANFLPLCVQQQDQVGFDQFQKLTLNGAREEAEKDYQLRFAQLQYRESPDIRWLEGRFAPKEDGTKLRKLLLRIRKGHKTTGVAGHDVRLALVAHFIKKSDCDPLKNGRYTSCNYQRLRQQVAKQLRVLVAVCDATPDLKPLVRGVDCASNELHTPPEVFAPLYRQARRAGFGHFSYHVGEDFHDLGSGIRAVWEALTFLDLQPGDRIGHATAIGIDPALWLQRTPKELVLSRQQMLDTLVFACHVLRDHPCGAALLARATRLIAELARKIYGKALSTDLDVLVRAWRWRDRCPLFLAGESSESELWLDPPVARSELGWREEAERADPAAYELWRSYHHPHTRAQAELLEKFDHAVVLSEEVLVALQQTVLKLVSERMIGIEVPLTSNLRIAQYRSYGEHHLWRWLGKVSKFANEPRPLVCLSSDDPGIFATNLRNEFVVAHQLLRDEFGLSEHDSLMTLTTLNRQARGLFFGHGTVVSNQPG